MHVKEVLKQLKEHNLYAKPEKCDFHKEQVEYLGMIITEGKVAMDRNKVKAIEDWPAPKNMTEIKSFLGFANFYQRFIENYSRMIRPMTRLE